MSCDEIIGSLFMKWLHPTHFSLSLLASLSLNKLSQTLLFILTISQILVDLLMKNTIVFHWRVDFLLFNSRTVFYSMRTLIKIGHGWHYFIRLLHWLLWYERIMIFSLLSLSDIIKTTPIVPITEDKVLSFFLASYD